MAATPLMRRSLASTPTTGSLNFTSMRVSSRIVEPAGGDSSIAVGAVVSVKVYCHVAAVPDGSNGLEGLSKSPMPLAPFQPT